MSDGLTWRQRLTRGLKSGVKDLLGPLGYRRQSWAQEGEDLILARMFDGQRDGYYVEVGSHHPFRFSNTYYFYRRGWQGLCIDPLPGTRARFARWRPRDVALEMGIGEAPATLTYHLFNEPAINTFSPELAAERDGHNNWRLLGRREVPVQPLAAVLHSRLPRGLREIDFLSVDVEGLDLSVLRSNDWTRWRPRIVIAECLDSAPARWGDDPVVQFMRSHDYFPVAKAVHSVFFLRDSQEFSR
jgi:FkbM family methyltransferase